MLVNELFFFQYDKTVLDITQEKLDKILKMDNVIFYFIFSIILNVFAEIRS